MAARDFFVEVWGIFTRWLKKTFRRPSFVFFAMVQPIIWFVLFTQSFASIAKVPGFPTDPATGAPISYLTFFTAAVVIQTVLASAMQSGIGMVNDIESGYMDKMRVAPIRRSSILLGKVMSDGVRILLQTIIIVILGAILGVTYATGIAGVLILFVIAVTFGIAWSGISTFVGLFTRNAEPTLMISLLTTFPLLFLSTAVMPENLLPQTVKDVSTYNPITYVANGLHGLVFLGFDWTALGYAFLIILVVGVITLSATTAMFRRAVAA